MILHIPHASDVIPDQFRDQIVLSDDDLRAELLLMTDAFTDELFACPAATTVHFPLSRLLVDVERFPDDDQEPMSRVGMGRFYTRTAYGQPLKCPLQPQEIKRLSDEYDNHHDLLTRVVTQALEEQGQALIVDCHSFPRQPLPCNEDQRVPRPDFCIGTDPFHTPETLTELARDCLTAMGYRVGINWPYSGALVPLAYYQQESRVHSIMIEVNRRLYMDEQTGRKTDSFATIQRQIHTLLGSIDAFAGSRQ